MEPYYCSSISPTAYVDEHVPQQFAARFEPGLCQNKATTTRGSRRDKFLARTEKASLQKVVDMVFARTEKNLLLLPAVVAAVRKTMFLTMALSIQKLWMTSLKWPACNGFSLMGLQLINLEDSSQQLR